MHQLVLLSFAPPCLVVMFHAHLMTLTAVASVVPAAISIFWPEGMLSLIRAGTRVGSEHGFEYDYAIDFLQAWGLFSFLPFLCMLPRGEPPLFHDQADLSRAQPPPPSPLGVLAL